MNLLLPSAAQMGKTYFSLSLLRLDIDFALLHNAAVPQWEASRTLKENVKSAGVTENLQLWQSFSWGVVDC